MTSRQEPSGRPKADTLDQRIGEHVRERRLLVGMTQEQLGSTIGVSFQQVQKYEKGTNRVSASRLRQIAAALDMPVSQFFGAAEGAPPGNDLDGRVVDQGLPADPARAAQGTRLMLAFERIQDRLVRQRIVDLVQTLAR